MNETLKNYFERMKYFLGIFKNSTSKKKSRNSMNDVMKNSNISYRTVAGKWLKSKKILERIQQHPQSLYTFDRYYKALQHLLLTLFAQIIP